MTSIAVRRHWRSLVAASGVLATLLVATACSGRSERPESRLDDLDLEAYSQVSYRPGTVFSFSLTTVESPVEGRVEDVEVDVDGGGLEVLGFAVTPPQVPDFDVAAGFPPTRGNLRGTTPVDEAVVPGGAEGVRLVVGLRVVRGEYTELHDLRWAVVGADGERRTHTSPVGLGQCYDDGRGVAECPRGWVEGRSGPPS
jgi:hypothetical protein